LRATTKERRRRGCFVRCAQFMACVYSIFICVIVTTVDHSCAWDRSVAISVMLSVPYLFLHKQCGLFAFSSESLSREPG
jgi:hypothetical protein